MWGHPSSIGGLTQSKRAGDGPKWWNHENDSSAARSGAAHWRRGRSDLNLSEKKEVFITCIYRKSGTEDH